jgi:8-oxo-dGTP pyrophosphatase MutT (NUDIX family)
MQHHRPLDSSGFFLPMKDQAVSLMFDPRTVAVVASIDRHPAVDGAYLEAQALRRHFANPPRWQPELVREQPFGARDVLPAAVLLPVVLRKQPMMLLTKRALHLNSHAGQIAFPGGKVDPADGGPVQTALREAWEEVGLDPGVVEILGTLPDYVTGTSFQVTPVVGLISAEPQLNINVEEVSEVFEVPLAFLMNPDNHRLHRLVHDGVDREWYSMAYADRGVEWFIWGATAGILRNLYRFLIAKN